MYILNVNRNQILVHREKYLWSNHPETMKHEISITDTEEIYCEKQIVLSIILK